MEKVKWTKLKTDGVSSTNFVLKGKGFAISYNPKPNSTPMIASMDSFLGSMLGGGVGSEETALIKNGKYYILDGDFRKEYAKVFLNGYTECKKIFTKNKECVSLFSD